MPSSGPANPSTEEVGAATDLLQAGVIPGAWPTSEPVARGHHSGLRFTSVAGTRLSGKEWLLGKTPPGCAAGGREAKHPKSRYRTGCLGARGGHCPWQHGVAARTDSGRRSTVPGGGRSCGVRTSCSRPGSPDLPCAGPAPARHLLPWGPGRSAGPPAGRAGAAEGAAAASASGRPQVAMETPGAARPT